MKCPACGSQDTHVIDTTRDASGNGIRRRRACRACGKRFTTIERLLDTTPLVVKRDGRRESFNRDKVAEGIRIACAKRPVAAEDIERLAGQVEAQVMGMSKPEITAREIGDMVLEGLRQLDEVAYIRFAIVYLNLKDLESIQKEIAKLLSER